MNNPNQPFLSKLDGLVNFVERLGKKILDQWHEDDKWREQADDKIRSIFKNVPPDQLDEKLDIAVGAEGRMHQQIAEMGQGLQTQINDIKTQITDQYQNTKNAFGEVHQSLTIHEWYLYFTGYTLQNALSVKIEPPQLDGFLTQRLGSENMQAFAQQLNFINWENDHSYRAQIFDYKENSLKPFIFESLAKVVTEMDEKIQRLESQMNFDSDSQQRFLQIQQMIEEIANRPNQIDPEWVDPNQNMAQQPNPGYNYNVAQQANAGYNQYVPQPHENNPVGNTQYYQKPNNAGFGDSTKNHAEHLYQSGNSFHSSGSYVQPLAVGGNS